MRAREVQYLRVVYDTINKSPLTGFGLDALSLMMKQGEDRIDVDCWTPDLLGEMRRLLRGQRHPDIIRSMQVLEHIELAVRRRNMDMREHDVPPQVLGLVGHVVRNPTRPDRRPTRRSLIDRVAQLMATRRYYVNVVGIREIVNLAGSLTNARGDELDTYVVAWLSTHGLGYAEGGTITFPRRDLDLRAGDLAEGADVGMTSITETAQRAMNRQMTIYRLETMHNAVLTGRQLEELTDSLMAQRDQSFSAWRATIRFFLQYLQDSSDAERDDELARDGAALVEDEELGENIPL